MFVVHNKDGIIRVPDFLNPEKWNEIRKKNKLKTIAWETVKLAPSLAIATNAAFIVDVKKHPDLMIENIFNACLFGSFMAFIFVYILWYTMEKNWLYMDGKLKEKFLGNGGAYA